MEKKNFRIYRSSAGSGKTYTLAKEYLTLALQQPHYFKHILAVTFTNKATQEMKGRIIEYLDEISRGKDTTLTKELMEATQLGKRDLTKRAKKVLSAILHAYSHFTVSTIDSFFQKVIRSFAREVGLQSGFKLELDQEKVLQEVIDNVLLEVGKDPYLTNWLTRYAENKVEEGKSWDFRGDIKKLSQELFREHFQSFSKDILEASRDEELIPEVLNKLKQIRRGFEETMKSFGIRANNVLDDLGLDITDFAYGQSGVMGYLSKLATGRKFEPGIRARSAIMDVEKWYSKTSKKKELIEQAFHNGLNEELASAIQNYDRHFLRYQSANQILRYIYNFGILSQVTKKLADYREENDVLLISDAARFLKGIIEENDAPFIYEKVGSTYNHFLIDEFQDTSGFQWDNFRPLIENSVGEGNVNLVVGDIKQSIYRWRGGDWRLLLEQVERDIGPWQTDTVTLANNWRSTKNVIDFNNALFNAAPQLLRNRLLEVIDEEVEDDLLEIHLKKQAHRVNEAYEDVFQQFPPTKALKGGFQGYVNIRFFPVVEEREEKKVSWKQQVHERLPNLVEEIQDRGYQLKDVAFLVRSKAEGKALADLMMAYKTSSAADLQRYSYEVVSSESLYMGSAFTVRLLINALRYLNNNGDNISRATVAFEYQSYILNKKVLSLHQLFAAAARPGKDEDFFAGLLPKDFMKKRAYLTKLALYELVEELVRLFQLSTVKGEYAYLLAFQDAVLDFSKNEKADVTSFLQWWDESGKRKSVQVSEELNAIRILTIHKSKGLQFKVVLVPYCDWKIDHNTQFDHILWSQSKQEPFDQLPYFPLKYSSDLKKTIYRQDYYEEQIRAQLDYLNILYVAFTRAEDVLLAFGPRPSIDKKGNYQLKDVSNLMFHFLSGDFRNREIEIQSNGGKEYTSLFEHWKTEQTYLELGQWPELSSAEGEIESSGKPTEMIGSYISNPWRNRLTIRQRSKDFFKLEDEVTASNINYGVLLHDLLSRIITPDQLPFALKEMEFEGAIGAKEVNYLEQQVKALLEHPEVKPWFSAEWEVRTEVPVIANDAFNQTERRMDRVMLKGDKAVVIDFKAAKNEDKQAAYRRQVREYLRILVEMGYKRVEGYLLYVHPVELEEVQIKRP
ncbi:UvrD-helicase domain-containing protein [Xanthovirga aplysinae]|uniref:UvrD-helicase domain-containing protein n=1 Tax=Xanthovirga aplysinae TaxID=2529853 RepID=UPI0012BC9C9C|nr:UvrD-helicase domain-containing protein [Xanthovirga aplysinae]MTI33400.1 ATP-dependent helicase/nuclease subunit A [Xanthovirga aplysinae]